MSSTYAEFSPQNAIRFVPDGESLPIGQYQYPFGRGYDVEQLRLGQEEELYYYPCELSDNITIEVSVAVQNSSKNWGATCDLINEYGASVGQVSASLSTVLSGNLSPTGESMRTFFFQFKPGTLGNINLGYYRCYIALNYDANNDNTADTVRYFGSDAIEIQESHPNTLPIVHWHNDNTLDDITVNVNGGFNVKFFTRVQGYIPPVGIEFTADDTGYDDQEYDRTLLSRTPYNIYKLVAGEDGISPFMASHLNQLFSCDNVWINSKQYTLHEGAKLELDTSPNAFQLGVTLQIRDVSVASNYQFPDNQPIVVIPTVPGTNLPFYQLSAGVIGLTSWNAGRPVMNQQDLLDLVEILNTSSTGSYYGTFIWDGHRGVNYIKAPFETATTATQIRLTRYMQVVLNADTPSAYRTLAMRTTAASAYVALVWGDGTWQQDFAPNATTYTHVYDNAGLKQCYLFYQNGTMTDYFTSSARVSGYAGLLSSSLTSFVSRNGILDIVDGNLFAACAAVLQTMGLQDNVIASVSGMNQAWVALNFIRFDGNTLTTAQLDNVVIPIYQALQPTPTPNGTFRVENQTPTAATSTTATLMLDDFITSDGWTTNHD